MATFLTQSDKYHFLCDILNFQPACKSQASKKLLLELNLLLSMDNVEYLWDLMETYMADLGNKHRSLYVILTNHLSKLYTRIFMEQLNDDQCQAIINDLTKHPKKASHHYWMLGKCYQAVGEHTRAFEAFSRAREMSNINSLDDIYFNIVSLSTYEIIKNERLLGYFKREIEKMDGSYNLAFLKESFKGLIPAFNSRTVTKEADMYESKKRLPGDSTSEKFIAAAALSTKVLIFGIPALTFLGVAGSIHGISKIATRHVRNKEELNNMIDMLHVSLNMDKNLKIAFINNITSAYTKNHTEASSNSSDALWTYLKSGQPLEDKMVSVTGYMLAIRDGLILNNGKRMFNVIFEQLETMLNSLELPAPRTR